MKRVAILLAIAVITAGTTGCAGRLRDWFYQGSYCGPTAAPVVTMPQPYAAPTCCPPACGVEPSCGAPAPYAGQVTYGPAVPGGCPTYDGGAVMAPQTFVAPSPE
jgi:hypothetical protein